MSPGSPKHPEPSIKVHTKMVDIQASGITSVIVAVVIGALTFVATWWVMQGHWGWLLK